MNTTEIRTANFGTHTIELNKHVTHVSTGGIWFNGLIQIVCYTSKNEDSGYIINYNVKTKKRNIERLKQTYIDSESVKLYGRKCVTKKLPILSI